MLSVNKREDMFDVRMLLLRITAACAVFYGVKMFLRDPENLASVMSVGGELWDEIYVWGPAKFMAMVDPNQQVEVMKSDLQI